MAAALRATEGGGYIFYKSSGEGIFKIFRPGGILPPTPYSRPLVIRGSHVVQHDVFGDQFERHWDMETIKVTYIPTGVVTTLILFLT